jgi:hypothetical protein
MKLPAPLRYPPPREALATFAFFILAALLLMFC